MSPAVPATAVPATAVHATAVHATPGAVAGVLGRAGFSPSTYEATVESLRAGVRALSDRVADLPRAAGDAVGHAWVPDWLADAVRACADRLAALGRGLVARVGELLEGAAAPVLFFLRAHDWITQVGAPASGVAGAVQPSALRATRTWDGATASAYRAAVVGQAPAAAQVHRVAATVASSLTACAVAGLAFYVALAVIVAKVVAAFVAAVAAFGSGVLSWAGLLIVVEEAAVTSGMVVSAVAGLVAVQGAAAVATVNVTDAARHASAFPHGHWPTATV
ncbi:hypothetical protein [Cellulomonas palmilytica]|uniref:hypothetical protein n=1 Tax=Cellulomonas palmilytica TaxID=2608402 RepID=UPI001F46AC5D|nr:hypothetical protein [Cellulomonas palmilytica]UJP39708.1 hypothetical protein F1D97_15635 [Cellulomonas palmilytica]